jgi:hypothetical protein
LPLKTVLGDCLWYPPSWPSTSFKELSSVPMASAGTTAGVNVVTALNGLGLFVQFVDGAVKITAPASALPWIKTTDACWRMGCM